MAGRRSRSDRRRACAWLPVLLLLCAPASRAGEPALDEAHALLARGRAAEAVSLLAANELAHAGEARFEYLYGVALLDVGRRGEAVASLERAVAARPDDPAARLELGRALYESGDAAGARRQFDWLLGRDPPATIRDTAQAYLRAMAPQRAGGGGWRRWIEFGGGYDTNANASTADADFFGIVLDPANVATESWFAAVAAGVAGTQPVGDRSRLRVAARLGQRWNGNAGFVDQTLASVDTVLEFGDGPTVFSVGAGGYYGLLDDDPHQWSASGDLGLSHAFAGGWNARGLLRYGAQRFDADFGSLSTLDSDRLLAAVSLWRAAGDGDFGFTAIAGRDDARASGSPYDNDRYGLQFDAGLHNAAGSGLRFQIAWQDVDYDDDPAFFTVLRRSDETWSLALGGEARDWPARGFSLLPRFAWTRNRSSISLYEYERFEFGLSLQRSF